MNLRTVSRPIYAGLFMITVATLMYEILLTRVFSVTMWYHFVAVAISVALFGMTVGANLVYLRPAYFVPEKTHYHLAASALLFALSIILSFLTYLSIPFAIHPSIVGIYSIGLSYTVIAVPFVFSGICVCLALTRFPGHVSRLYAADLTGAALGCILLIYALKITDGPTAVIIVASLASLGAFSFASAAGAGRMKRAALLCTVVLGSVAAGHALLALRQVPVLRLMWVKGQVEPRALYEKWNSFSRIRVWGDPTIPTKPFGWGLSETYPPDRSVRQLNLDIDAGAGTTLTGFAGQMEELQHLKYDVTSIAHYLRAQARVLVIGSGGGRDILSALAFGQKTVVGVEINKDIIDAVNLRFGDFTGHLDRHPKVTFVHDEARSYIARTPARYDIIQASLVDTWAATAAGAFVLAENSLYTVEAWTTFLTHLSPRGILTFSRWYFRDAPGEMYRLTSLASASLRRVGVEHSRRHIVIVRHLMRGGVRGTATDAPDGVATILVSREPLTDHDLRTVDQVARTLQFAVVLSPRASADPNFATIASGTNLDILGNRLALNIAPPTDNSPFFFYMLRLRDVFDPRLVQQRFLAFQFKAAFVLGALLVTVIALAFLFILLPLILTMRKIPFGATIPLSIFFSGIGLGFMLVEISQMQRLIVFLGHPTYSLSVVLFTLLISSGIGSYSTQTIRSPMDDRSAGIARLFVLLCALAVFGQFTPHVLNAFRASPTSLRILVGAGTIFPLGLFLGMAFPLGMKLASVSARDVSPWLWGINGAMSVCASVMAIVVAVNAGISTAFWLGAACYATAFVAFVWASRGVRTAPGAVPVWSIRH